MRVFTLLKIGVMLVERERERERDIPGPIRGPSSFTRTKNNFFKKVH